MHVSKEAGKTCLFLLRHLKYNQDNDTFIAVTQLLCAPLTFRKLTMNFSIANLQRIVLASLLLAVNPTAHAYHDNDSMQPLFIGVGTVAAVYGFSWLSFKFHHSRAQKRYEMPIVIVAAHPNAAHNRNERMALRDELWQLIRIDNAACYDANSTYRNYPLVEFVQHLNWYINRFKLGKYLTFGTSLSNELRELQEQLELVRFYIVSDEEYINQRRHAQERNENGAQQLYVDHRQVR